MAETATPPGIDIRFLDTVEEVHRASAVLAEVWGGDRGGMPPNLLRALAHAGNYAVGLYDEERMVGASVAFFAEPGRTPSIRPGHHGIPHETAAWTRHRRSSAAPAAEPGARSPDNLS